MSDSPNMATLRARVAKLEVENFDLMMQLGAARLASRVYPGLAPPPSDAWTRWAVDQLEQQAANNAARARLAPMMRNWLERQARDSGELGDEAAAAHALMSSGGPALTRLPGESDAEFRARCDAALWPKDKAADPRSDALARAIAAQRPLDAYGR